MSVIEIETRIRFQTSAGVKDVKHVVRLRVDDLGDTPLPIAIGHVADSIKWRVINEAERWMKEEGRDAGDNGQQ